MDELELLEEEKLEIENEIDKLEENMKKIRKQNEELLEDLKKEKSINSTIEKLNKLAENNPDKPRTLDHIYMMTQCLEHSLSLEVLFETLERTDKDKLLRIYEINFDRELRNMRKKLNKSSFHFTNVDILYDKLNKVLDPNDSKLFIFSICRFVNSQGKIFLNAASLFVSQLLKNILLIQSEEFDERNEFLDNVKRYINTIKEV